MPLGLTAGKIPRILSARTASVENALAVLAPRDQTQFGGVAYSICKAFPSPCDIFIDFRRGFIVGTMDTVTQAAWRAAVAAHKVEWLTVNPDTAGMLAKWTISDNQDWPNDETNFFNPFNKKSLAQVLNNFFSERSLWAPANYGYASQEAGSVMVFTDDGGLDADFDLIDVAGDQVAFTLPESVYNRLAFE